MPVPSPQAVAALIIIINCLPGSTQKKTKGVIIITKSKNARKKVNANPEKKANTFPREVQKSKPQSRNPKNLFMSLSVLVISHIVGRSKTAVAPCQWLSA